MKAKLDNRGFTMMEVLTVLSIIIIMLALVSVSVISYQKSLKQLEYDGKAKEIYLAAQNHLTAASEQGLLLAKKPSSSPSEDGGSSGAGPVDTVSTLGYKDSGEAADTDVYYFVVSSGTALTLFNASDSVLDAMLPFGSIDDNVRIGGSYIIRYDLNSAKVLDVFYVEGVDMDVADFSTLHPGYEGDDKKSSRIDVELSNGKAIVGYYGGEEAIPYLQLEKPTIKVDNAERLVVHVTDPNSSITGASAVLIVKGKTSGAQGAVPIDMTKSIVQPSALAGYDFDIVLDDVTGLGMHFINLFGPAGDYIEFGSEGLIPGEDVEIYVEASSTEAYANVVKSARITRNSLFSSVIDLSESGESGGGGDASPVRTAMISNIRHLENLDSEISGFVPADLAQAEVASGAYPDVADATITTAEQAVDLSWTGFLDDLGNANASVSLHRGGLSSAEGTFMPVYLDTDFSYIGALTDKGALPKISGIVVETSDEAGLFGSLEGGVVKNLELVDFDITSTNGDAGALAGAMEGTEVLGVFVHNTPGADEPKLQISGAGSVGGLVGKLRSSSSGGSVVEAKVDECAASVYVKSTGAVTSGDSSAGAAGGLVGYADGAVIANSYSGGHTNAGVYSTDTEDEVAGRMNVQGAVAGGLVGVAEGTSISTCYSTCSAQGSTESGGNAGGLVGSMSGGSVARSYAAGLARAAATGAFAASVDGTTATGCYYFDFVNRKQNGGGDSEGQADEVKATSAGDLGGVAAFDQTTATYADFVKGASPTVKYDLAFYDEDAEECALNTVAELVEATTGAAASFPKYYTFLTTHFGDWPSYETLVLNSAA